MRLLVSLCSSTTEAPEALVVYDALTAAVEPVSLPDSGAGVFGLCVANGSIYCLIDQGRPSPAEAERSELCRLDSATLAVRWRYAFRVGRDVHSVAAGGHRLLVTSTGTDEVLELALDDHGRIEDERVIWRPNPGSERADRHHVNDVVIDDGRILVSGFGPRPTPGSGWEDATAGFVRALPSGDLVMGPVYHPHSICRLSPDELALCESPHRRVITSTGRRSGLLPGYSRGLCLAGGSLFAGTSRQRRPSEEAAILDYTPSHGPNDPGVCAISRLDTGTLRVQEVIPLDPHGREVYDIVVLAPA